VREKRHAVGSAIIDKVQRIASRSILLLILAGVWLLVTGMHAVQPVFFPSAAGLWASFIGVRPELLQSIGYSVAMTLSGFAIGVTFGIGLGLAMAYSIVVRRLFGDLMTLIRPVPIFALIPLFLLWFGIGWEPQVALIALGTSVILGVTTTEAVRNVQSIFVKAALTLGASRRQVYRTVVLPSITPHLAGAVRVAAAASWGLDVAAEFIGAQTGLGHLMVVREEYLDTGSIVLIVLIYAVLAIVLDYGISMGTRHLLRWSERSSTGGVVGSLLGR
jgi:ABC-type nitrate/sulfonate/bicarbonate transport system permease component